MAAIKPQGTFYIHADHLNSATIMSDENGQTVDQADYLPFGGQRATSIELIGYRFTDQEWDKESGLYNYDARLYDPVVGRFLSADSIVPDWYDPQALNQYAYCRNNPLVFVDPNGHEIVQFDSGEEPNKQESFDKAWNSYLRTNPYERLGSLQGIVEFSHTLNRLLDNNFDVSRLNRDELDNFLSKANQCHFEKTRTTTVLVLGTMPFLGHAAEEAAGLAPKSGTETVQRWMSKAELEATKDTGLFRGGRSGTHYATDAANSNPLRARQRLSLYHTPEVRVDLEVPAGRFSPPSKVAPLIEDGRVTMPGGGMERTATGTLPATVKKVY